MVLEAAGRDEEIKGKPTVGAAGYFLWSNLKREGILRDGFRVHNVLSCRPLENKLVGAPYEKEAIECCRPNLDATIFSHVEHCKQIGKTPVILTLGKPAFQRCMGMTDDDPILKPKGKRRLDYYLYPHWVEEYSCWLVAAPHPSYLLQGNRHFTPILVEAAKQAIRMAATLGYKAEVPDHLCDPAPATFAQWAEDYLRLAHARKSAGLPPLYLAFDIETAWKEGSDEEEITKDEDYDNAITRCSFAYEGRHRIEAVSVPWHPPYTHTMARLFGDEQSEKVGWNSDTYDNPRIKRQMAMRGTYHDGMLAWHVLRSSLRKGLGAVVPFFCPDHPMWKHWHGARPALYSAIDSAVTIRCWLGILGGLKQNDLWDVYRTHIYEVQPILGHMSGVGVLLDPKARLMAERKVSALLKESDAAIQGAVPKEVRATKVYKKPPADLYEEVEVPKGYVLKKGEEWA